MVDGQMCIRDLVSGARWPCRSSSDQTVLHVKVGKTGLNIKTGWDTVAVPILDDPYKEEK